MQNYSDVFSAIKISLVEANLIKAVISNPIRRNEGVAKISVVPLKNKSGLYYQLSFYKGEKVTQENFKNLDELTSELSELTDLYKQWDIQTADENIKILVNKSGNFKVAKSKIETKSGVSEEKAPVEYLHNRVKNYILPEGEPIDWLVSLGIMNQRGRVLAEKQKKFRQINRFLEIFADVADKVPNGSSIVDVGCGKSYLTFGLYYYLNILNNKDIRIIGIDLKQDVVEYCNKLAIDFGFNNLSFYNKDIESFKLENETVGAVVSLHACDTATDYALHFAITCNANVILAVPCCQHELFNQIENDISSPLLEHGILKERFGALLTDALRAQLLEACGYKCSVMEFIDMEHTPKNVLIRAAKREIKEQGKQKMLEKYFKLADAYSASPTLFKLLENRINDR